MENRIKQVLEAIDEAFKMAFGADMNNSFIFNLGAGDTHIAEEPLGKSKIHLMPVECFIEGCEGAVAPIAATSAENEAAPAEGDKKGEPEKKEEKKEEKKPEAKEKPKSSQTRVLEMDKGFDELEGLFDLRGGSKKKQILF